MEDIYARAARNGVPRKVVNMRFSMNRFLPPEDAILPLDQEPVPELRVDPPKRAFLDLSWDERFLALAQFWNQNSKDPSTRVGAVIVGRDKREVTLGYNGFPPGVPDDDRLTKRETKYPLMIHAERNALDNCRFDTQGSTLYATLAPCCGCAASIISKGIKRVVCPEPDWSSDVVRRHGIDIARDTLEKAGVIISWVAVPA
jgi:dCMP deaminase